MDFLRKIFILLGWRGSHNKRNQNIEASNSEETLRQEEIQIIVNAHAQEIKAQKITEPESKYFSPISYPITIKSYNQTLCTYVEGIIRNDQGVMEDYFFDYSISKLNGKLKNDVQIELGDRSITPDFVYVDDETKRFIAIEIDEPYSINVNGKFIAIHYKASDDIRNKALIAAGWDVIRFAEKQIAINPSECVTLIEQYANSKDLNEIESIACWTKEEADQMIIDKYRNSYLPYEFQKASSKYSTSSYRSLDIIFINYKKSRKGESYTVLHLGHKKDWNSWNNSCECWIPELDFWQKFNETSVSKIIKKTSIDFDYDLVNIIKPLKFEAFGKLNGNYFNLFSESDFKIVFSSLVNQILDKQPFFQNKEQLIQLINNKVTLAISFEEKIKKLSAAGIKEVYISEKGNDFEEMLKIIKKYGVKHLLDKW